MMSGLMQQVMGSIDESTVQQIASGLGISSVQAQSTIASALPSIMAAFGQHANNGGGDALHSAAQQISGMVGGAGARDSAVQNMLGQIFGAQQGSAAHGIGTATGLPQEHVQHLLAVLGPVILSAIANHTSQTGASPQGLSQMLGEAVQHAETQGGGIGGMLGSLFGKM